MRLRLLPRVGALEVYSTNLRLNTRSPSRTAGFASLFFVILYYERVI